MSRLFALIGATIGGWIGWYLAAPAGLMAGYVVSVVGTADRRLSGTSRCGSSVLRRPYLGAPYALPVQRATGNFPKPGPPISMSGQPS